MSGVRGVQCNEKRSGAGRGGEGRDSGSGWRASKGDEGVHRGTNGGRGGAAEERRGYKKDGAAKKASKRNKEEGSAEWEGIELD